MGHADGAGPRRAVESAYDGPMSTSEQVRTRPADRHWWDWWHESHPTFAALTGFFAFQSLQAYVAFGWFAKLLHSHGISTTEAGWLLALLNVVTVPLSMVVPAVVSA